MIAATELCIACDAPREIDPARSKPGEIAYKACGACGQIGIYTQGDQYVEVRRKKAATGFYQDSKYRGGKLVVAAVGEA